jgi:hypothetical protein
MPGWTIAIEITGSSIDADGLVRLEKVFEHDFPDFHAECVIWSGRLGVHLTVRSPTPPDALESAMRMLEFAFDEARLDIDRVAVFENVTMRPVPRREVSETDALPRTLLRRLTLDPVSKSLTARGGRARVG